MHLMLKDLLFRGFPSKILVYSWWAFVFLLLETYAANLSAVYTTNVIESNINSARNLLLMPKMIFGSDAGFANDFLKVNLEKTFTIK